MLLSNVKLKPGEDDLVAGALLIELVINNGTPEDGFIAAPRPTCIEF